MRRGALCTALLLIILLAAGIPMPPVVLPTFDRDGNYTGFDDLPEDYSEEQAKRDGCVISDLNSPENAPTKDPVWRNFVEKAEKGQTAFVRIMFVYNTAGRDFQDVYYHRGSYCTFIKNSSEQKRVNFPYLLERTGRLSDRSTREGTVVILCRERDQSYRDIYRNYVLSATAASRQDDYRFIFIG